MKLRDLFRSSRTRQAPEATRSKLTLDQLAPGRVPIAQCTDRSECTVAGRIQAVEQAEPGRPHALKAVLEDDSGATIRLVWLGRTSIPGIGPGVSVRASGTVQTRGGTHTIVDPSYTILNRGPAQ